MGEVARVGLTGALVGGHLNSEARGFRVSEMARADLAGALEGGHLDSTSDGGKGRDSDLATAMCRVMM